MPSRAGPCLPHCYHCSPATALLARAAIAYAVASATYLLLTRRLATPLRDSLTDEQRRIRDESARLRGRLFAAGMAVGVAAAAWAPLRRREEGGVR